MIDLPALGVGLVVLLLGIGRLVLIGLAALSLGLFL